MINRPVSERFNEKWIPEPYSGCWLWMAACMKRRFNYGLILTPGRKCELAHRVSWKLHRGEIPHGLHVLHRCDTPLCVNPDHLFLGTYLDNAADMVAKGRAARGETFCKSKLTERDVLSIRNDPRNDIDLSKHYGISKSQVWKIRSRQQWRHV